MKRILLSLLTTTMVTTLAFAQEYTNADDSDPAAKAVLDQVKKKYESYETVEVNFSLDIEFPEEPLISQKGQLSRSGDKYYMETNDYTALSDGAAIWFIMKNNKEVQINEVPDEDEDVGLLSPDAMFTFYEKGDYVYILTNEFMENGKPIQQIEFKPLDKFSEYSKLRLTVHKKTKDIIRVKAFSKDGTRYTLKVDKVTPNKTLAASLFVFDANKYPDYHVEDLR